MKRIEQKNNRNNSYFNTFRLEQQMAQIKFDETNTYLQQKRDIKRKSDQLLGLTNMDYDKFCEEIDKAIPIEMMDFMDNVPIGSSRNYIKAFAPTIHEHTGKSYYEMYLENVIR